MRTHVSDMTAIRTKDNDLLLIVDVQEDFTYGALENPEAILRLAGIVKFIRNFNGKKAATEDTHYMDYAATQEGINLPVPHCIKGTPGHDIVPEILAAIKEKHEEGAPIDYTIIEKETFGSLNASSSLKHGFTLTDVIADHHYDDIYILGFCTGICAISNAVIAKAADPEARIHILEPLCACVTKQSHDTAIAAMEMLQMDIITWDMHSKYTIAKDAEIGLLTVQPRGGYPKTVTAYAREDGIRLIERNDIPKALEGTPYFSDVLVATQSNWNALREAAKTARQGK